MRRRKAVIMFLSVLIALAAGVGAWSYLEWRKWEPYVGPARENGVRVKGDTSVSPTANPVLHAWLRLVGWRTVAVLEVPPQAATAGYRVGFVPFTGDARLHAAIRTGPRFRMRVGREDPIFFAVAKDGSEVPLTLVARTSKDDPRYADLPLY